MNDFTNFHAYSHGDLRNMVQSMDSGGVMSAADPWRRATDTLKQIHSALNTAASDATASWQGSTSDTFHARMINLSDTVNNAAAYANDAANVLQMMSEAIDTAKRNMPEEPSFWDKAGDAISDTAQSAVGVDNEDTRTSVADSRKAKAVGVMETLAASYRSATSYLKPPPPPPPPPRGYLDDKQQLPPPDNSGADAISALIVGGGLGLVNAGQSIAPSGASKNTGSSSNRAPQAPKPAVIRPADPGISGGTANPVPQPKGPSTGIDGIHGGTGGPGTTSTIGGTSGIGGGRGINGGGGLGTAPNIGPGGLIGRGEEGMLGGSGIGSNRAGFTGSNASKSGAFGAGGMGGANGPGGIGGGAGGAGAGGAGGSGAGGRSGGSLTSKAGGVIGESTRSTAGGRSFTEGGSGIGRSRPGQGAGAGQAGGPGQGGAGQGQGAAGHGQAGKKDKKKGKDRPDYLVEDEETWASGDQVNPNVVE
ncbi:hypothetical protein AB0K51_18525 [Kitasatospora sp. NPDC049285]|uniref:WXG100 family type VII secretion target n=1 Tax=Kitasatospora sp. NPDC049285 TaxID=3157096 RepID=UPI00341A9844